MLNVTWMRTLREVAERGSFSAAAQAMAFTQPAVSRQVALLERQAGTPLVARTRQGVRLTDAGRLLVGHADAIIARLDAAEEQLAELAGLRRGRVRLRELAGDPWIQGAGGGPASRLVQRACRAAGFEPRIAFETDDPLVTWGLVAAGVGVALASGFGLAAVPADVSVCSLGADSPVRHIEAATLQGLRTPAQAALLDVLRTLTRSW